MEIPRGRGVLKAKFSEAMYENKLEFPGGGGGAKQKTFGGGSMDIFWNCTMPLTSVITLSLVAILVIYLTQMLKMDDDSATAIYHAFNMLCYFSPLFGAMLADSLLGKYK